MNELSKKLCRNLLRPACTLLPLNHTKAVCQSFAGRGYSDSPKAIADELLRRNWSVYWLVKDRKEAESLPHGIIPLEADTPSAVYHMATARVWVDNCRKWGRLYKRPNQLYIQTWHGFPLKRIEGDAADTLDPEYLRAAKMDSSLCDLFLSNSSFLTEIYRRAFWYEGEVLECGFPRNDVLFSPDRETLEKVRTGLNLPSDKRLCLYAPTFRRDRGLSVYDMDYAQAVRALQKRFGGEWLILAKLHPNVAEKSHELNLPGCVVDASSWPDIQELYIASDVLITDYSSVMFDYMHTGKPCFLYVNDLEAYRSDRNFYLDLDALPFARAENNGELEQIILNFQETAQRQRTKDFFQAYGIRENGTAARQTVDWIERH